MPKADEPLPRFLDDPTAAKFMAAVAVEPNRRRRLIVELLARTGMRVGELGGLRDDAVYPSVTAGGYGSRSASCTTNAPSRCTRCSSG